MNANLDKLFSEGLATAIPKGGVTISSWAEQYRVVSASRSARPGKWSNDVFPFLRGIMDCVTEPDVRKVVLQKSSQVGGTECLVNILTYYMHQDPSMMIYYAEIENKARTWTNECLDPTIMESPELRRCMLAEAGTSADNNQSIKRFRGGQLAILWASSAANLSSRPARIVCFDEVDAFEMTKEGDPVKIAEARTKTFRESKKIILVSSPRDRETSIIEREYNLGDQREFYVPCPHCGFYQTLKWSNLKWDDADTAADAYYVCGIIEGETLTDGCGAVLEDEDKVEMLAGGLWRPSAPFKGTASFKINEMYSPMTTWGDMAVDFLEAKKHRDTLRPFVNTRLGESFAEEGEKIDYGNLTLNIEDYEAEVPLGVEFLTAGVDVQGDRLEVEVVGWGRDLESWSIDYAVLEGSPSLPDVWFDLTEYLTKGWEGVRESGLADGLWRVNAACIDTGGHHTDEVYNYCKRNAGRRWFAVKGLSTRDSPLVGRPTRNNKARVKLFGVGTDTAKDQIFDFLKVPEAGPGYCHFPNNEKYGEAYLKMLCSEVKRPRFRLGKQYFVYEKVSANARNEALDLRVYATAAREILKPSYRKPVRRGLPAEAEARTEKPQVSSQQDDPPPTFVRQKNNVVPIRSRSRIRTKGNPFNDYKV
ncbi:MAG: phage terminase large subunit family protein [Pyrinomonadaceae bacterium]